MSGSRIAFAVAESSFTDRTIYVANADGSNMHDILPAAHSMSKQLWGWTPDGEQIIFLSDFNRERFHYDIFTVQTDGSQLTNLTPDSPHDDRDVDFRP